jgi:uncharacterized protein (TIGR03067 family)
VQPAPSALAQDPLAPLQGRWVVASAEHQGKPFDVITGGVMTIAGAGFEIRTASGTLLRGTLRVDTSARPWQLDLLHADGERWEAIYVLEDREWTLNYVAAGDEPRPSTFATSPASEATIITLRREPR